MAKILLACHEFFPRYYTGTETLVLEVADELVRRGHSVEILTTEPLLPGDEIPDCPQVKTDEYGGHKVWRLYIPDVVEPIKRMKLESYDPRLTCLFNKVLDSFNADVAHIFHLMDLTSRLVDILKQREIKTFFTTTDYWLLCPKYQLVKHNDELCSGPNPSKCFLCLLASNFKGLNQGNANTNLQNLVQRRILLHREIVKKLDGVLFSNKFTQNLFYKNEFICPNEYINPFPVPKRAEEVYKLGEVSIDSKLKIAFIGTLRPTKGPQIIINACKQLKNRKDIELQIWGGFNDNNSFHKQLKKSAKEVEWINFCGTFEQERFHEVLADIHVVVIPSTWYENTPLTALTALAAKRVLVVSNLGGLSSLVEDGVTGFLVPPGNHKALARTIRGLANNNRKVVKASKAISFKQTVSDYVDKLEEIYN
ncbi:MULTISPECIES: glycosyltransferase [unclassified Candidatus Frackibacter]|uniref:glycosyltransferase n=1 Tax=unclassified Candidatus Frackibacter TaxID=2648818 RepID=UPI000891B9F8|nr:MULTISPECIES: glycosyltransferase [unclassified Candidatus Frackibacter]SDC82835.1 Glycosyltransferase involved in cell wall bisynthesis [Candidatus Frackibacter sp. WG11]SEM97305.1 Glycosyltransferase involved in cell wall bisynthesis [Candidatus Frackibacter sp. WG12]SFM06002.1 Glycosyltransferase involved in cell wall bisynthesis [Candidatus Frackibacter sp. WG13]